MIRKVMQLRSYCKCTVSMGLLTPNTSNGCEHKIQTLSGPDRCHENANLQQVKAEMHSVKEELKQYDFSTCYSKCTTV